MAGEDYRIELFVFPDGTTVEMLVFEDGSLASADRLRERARQAAGTGGAGAGREAGGGVSPGAGAPGRAAAAARRGDDPCVCPVCASDLVQPVDWVQRGRGTWEVRLRCPECETARRMVLGREAVERLNRVLYQTTQALAREAAEFERRNFLDEAEKFIWALRRDLIAPDDF